MKDNEKDEGKKETPATPEMVIVTEAEKDLEAQPGPQTDHDEVPTQKAKKPADKEEAEVEDDRDEEDDKEESRLGTSEELESEQERKDKSKHKSRRQRQKDAERRLRTERDYLERRNDQLEREVVGLKKRMDSTDKSTLDQRIANAKTQIARAERIHADATTAGKGDEATEALKIRDNLRDSLRNMEARKEQIEKEEKEPPAAEQPSPETISNVREWMGRNKWFDPSLKDQDSKVVRALDVSVGQDGFDPASPEYFEELDRRIAKYLSHRVKKGDDAEETDPDDEEEPEERPQRKVVNGKGKKSSGGPRFRTGGPGRDLKDNEVFLTPDRIAALKDSGAWDDPVLRQKMLKRYKEWDIEHADELNR